MGTGDHQELCFSAVRISAFGFENHIVVFEDRRFPGKFHVVFRKRLVVVEPGTAQFIRKPLNAAGYDGELIFERRQFSLDHMQFRKRHAECFTRMRRKPEHDGFFVRGQRIFL